MCKMVFFKKASSSFPKRDSLANLKRGLMGRPVVLIIGGGYAGCAIAKKLDSKFNVFILERKDYRLHNIGALRSMNKLSVVNDILIPYDHLLKNGEVIQCEVTCVTKHEVYINGLDIPLKFDYLIFATGTSYGFPAKVSDPTRAAAFQAYVKAFTEISNCNHVCIVGGGPVGCGLSGEIATEFPGKRVTLIQAGEKLVNRANVSDKFRDKIHQKLTKRGVNVMLGEQVIIADELLEDLLLSETNFVRKDGTVIEMRSGKIVECDLVIYCTGARTNKKCYEAHFPTTEEGRLRVNEYLQVIGHPNIFAVGDCSGTGEAKLAYHAANHSDIVAQNLNCNDLSKMKSYKPSEVPLMLVSTGATGGATQIPNSEIVFGSWFTKQFKSANLMAKDAWGDMNCKYTNGKQNDKWLFSKSKGNSASSVNKEKEFGKLAFLVASCMRIKMEEAETLLDGLPVLPCFDDYT